MKTLRGSIITAAILVAAALAITPSLVLGSGNGRVQTLRVDNAASSPSPASPNGQGPNTDSQIAQMYLNDSDFVHPVNHVAVKRVTWGQIASYVNFQGFKIGGQPIDPNRVVDVVVQYGTVAPAAFGQGADGPNPQHHAYNYAINVIDPNNIGAFGFVISDPDAGAPSWWGQLHAQETDASK